MKQIHVIIALSVFSIALLFFLSSFLPHHYTEESSTGTTDVKLQLLQLREQSVRDYVSKLEQEVMKLAMDKKSENKHFKNLRPQHHSGNVMYEHSPHQNEHVLREKPQHEEHMSEQKSQLEEHAGSIGLISSSISSKISTSSSSSHNQEEHAPLITRDSSSSSSHHSSSSDIKAVSIAIDPDFQTWQDSLKRKIHCYLTSYTNIGFYHYHVRKAAGTTIRDVVKIALQHTKTHAMLRTPYGNGRHRSGAVLNSIKVPTYVDGYYETEGIVLHDELLKLRDVFTITSLREPISRIVSLYWYEHVGWYAGILKQVQRCKTFDQWVQHWRDSSSTKQEFIKKNPGNNYVEIENYYVKMLVGWQGDRTLNKEDLEKAKAILRQFDMIFITEWMEDETQIDVMNALFSGRAQVTAGHKVQGNFRMKENLKDNLAPNENELKQELIEMNQYDIALYDYAQSLMSFRLKHIIPLVERVKKQVVKQHSIHVQSSQSPISIVGGQTTEDEENLTCPVTPQDISNRKMDMMKKYKPFVGVFQPPGHKGP